MTTELAGAIAYTLVVVWAIIMLLLLQRYLRPAGHHHAQRTHDEPVTERGGYDTAWSASATSYDRTPEPAPCKWWGGMTPDQLANAVWGPIEAEFPKPRTVYRPAPAAQPAYQPAPAPAQPRPAVQPVPVEQPIAVPNWPVRKSKEVQA